MTSPNNFNATAEHLRNEVWVMLDSTLPDLIRITDAIHANNPNALTPQDYSTIRAVLYAITGLVAQRRLDAYALEDLTTH